MGCVSKPQIYSLGHLSAKRYRKNGRHSHKISRRMDEADGVGGQQALGQGGDRCQEEGEVAITIT